MSERHAGIPPGSGEGGQTQADTIPKPVRRADHPFARFWAALLALQCRCGRARQGDPGTAQAIVSLEDEFVCRYASGLAAPLHRRYAGASGDVASPWTRAIFHLAQRRAERFALQQRKSVMQADHWLDENLGFAGGL